MELTRHANWIEGRWCEAARGGEFEVGERIGGTERWARSGAEDAERALRSCAISAARWSSLSRADRLRQLRRVHAELEALPLAELLAPDLALEPAELRERLDDELFRFVEGLELFAEGPEQQGVGVFCAHWSEFPGALALRMLAQLAAGRTLLLRSDRRLPRAAELVVRAFENADVAPAPLALLHGDLRELDHALFATPGLALVRLRELDSVLRELAPRLRSRVETTREFWRVSNVSIRIVSGANPALLAPLCVERFLGRAGTLSAQFPGTLARVLCHERLFSRFTEELLACLERSTDARRPVPAIDADLPEHVAHAWALGLDEGATPIHGVAPDSRDAQGGPAGNVFTNVSPRSGLARLTRPAPVLALVRVPEGTAAEELQRELDGGPMMEPER
ncbi:MAG: aldehyde dehydrogenase family protein [Planctomycetota bacterium]|nr:aldehyde dehydrogenase family protein [Planctomycetota bacterium]